MRNLLLLAVDLLTDSSCRELTVSSTLYIESTDLAAGKVRSRPTSPPRRGAESSESGIGVCREGRGRRRSGTDRGRRPDGVGQDSRGGAAGWSLTKWRLLLLWTASHGRRLDQTRFVQLLLCNVMGSQSHEFWKVMEFMKGIFQAWKVMENDCGHGSHGIPPVDHGIF